MISNTYFRFRFVLVNTINALKVKTLYCVIGGFLAVNAY